MEFLGPVDGLVVFSSERLWPQIDALAHWGDQLSELVIASAYGDDEEGGPADRLRSFVQRYFPQVSVRIVGPFYDDDPRAVVHLLEGLVAEEGRRWLIDASGGSRLTYAGAVLAAASGDPRVRVIHRDSDGPWVQLGASGATRPLVGLDPRATDRYSVDGLLAATWSDDRRDAAVMDADVEPEIEQAALACHQGADWAEVFTDALAQLKERLGVSHVASGPQFERFVLSLVRAMGVQADDVAVSAVLYDGLTPVQEVDVVVNSHGRLHVIDCKLVEEQRALPLGTQVREAYATRRRLGDASDQYVMLRPTMTLRPEIRSLCTAYDVRVVDEQVLATTPLPQALERLIKPPTAPAATTLGPSRLAQVPIRGDRMDLHLDFVRSRSTWRVYDLASVVVVKVSSRSLTLSAIEEAVRRGLEGKAKVVDVAQTRSSRVVSVAARPEGISAPQLCTLLETVRVDLGL